MSSDNGQVTDVIDLVVTEAELEIGLPQSVVSSRSKLDIIDIEDLMEEIQGWKGLERTSVIQTWTDDEKLIVKENLGKLSLEQIGNIIGRSSNAVKLRFTREGWTAPSKQPDEINASQIGNLLGMCGKSIARLIDRSILPGRTLPMGRNIRVVKKQVLKRWLVNPQNWVYFDWHRIQEPHLRRMCEIETERWGDEWLSAGEAGAILGCDHRSINRWLHKGVFQRAKKWGSNWKFLLSEIEEVRDKLTPEGSLMLKKINYTDKADGFLILSRAVGFPYNTIERLMGPNWNKKASYRINTLHRMGKIPSLIEDQNLDIQYRKHPKKDSPDIFVDWRMCSNRYLSLMASVNRFNSGVSLRKGDITNIRAILHRWATWYAPDNASCQPAVGMLAPGGTEGVALSRLMTGYALLASQGLDPLQIE